MYLGFELNKYSCLSTVLDTKADEFRRQGKGRYDKLSSYLIGAFENKEVIDAEKIARHIFPPQKVDVFLSHSHADEKNAIELAISLQKKGLSIFVDSCVWGYFHDLLDELNEVYAEPKRNDAHVVYDYRKATGLTAGVHMMLLGALNQMIERSELFIFLNTNNSIPLEEYQSFDRTFSPWIYSELQFSSFVKQTTPTRRLRESFESYDSAEQMLKSTAASRSDVLLAFKAFNKHLPKISGQELRQWYDQLPAAIPNKQSAENALDALYESYLLPDRFSELRHKWQTPHKVASE